MRLRVPGVLALLVLVGVPLFADTFEVNSGGGNWSNLATWTQNGLPATRYPGSLAGTVDTVGATVATLYTVTVDVSLTEAVTLTTDCPSNTSTCVIDTGASGLLKLTGSSTIGTDAKIRLTGGTIQNDGTLTIAPTADFDMVSGTLTGFGATILASHPTTPGQMNVSGGSLDAHTLNVNGSVVQSATWSIDNGAIINIDPAGVYNLQTGNIATNSPAASQVINDGTLMKSGAGNSHIDAPLSNNNTVDVMTGGIVMGGDPTHNNGTFNLNSGTGLEVRGTFMGTCQIVGGGTASVVGTPTVAAGGTLNIDNVAMNGGWIQGPVSGSGTVNINGTATFTGGVWRRNLVVNMLNGSFLNFPGTAAGFIDDADVAINNGATMNVSPGAGSLGINNGGSLTNNGTLNLLGDVTITSDLVGNPFINNGSSLVKSTGPGSAFINLRFSNLGSVSVTSGVLKLMNGGSHFGTWFAGTGSGIAFDGGVHALNLGSMSGSGTIALGAGTLDVDTNFLLPNTLSFQLVGGTLTGMGVFNLQGPFLWTGGSMDNSSGNGQTVLQGSSSQIASTTQAVKLIGRTISQTGTFTYNPTAGKELSIDSGGQFLNTGTFHLVGDATINSNGLSTPKFVYGSGGTINKSTGGGTATFFPYFSNNQTLNLTSGSVTLRGGGQELGTVNYGPSGTSRVIVQSSNFSVVTPPVFSGPSILKVDGASGVFNMLANVTVEKLELTGGATITGGGTLTVNTSMLWENGSMTGPGTTTVTSLIDASAPTGPLTLNNRTLNNNGTFNWNGDVQNFLISNGGTFNNNGTFTALGNGQVGSATGTIVNNGTFEKTGGAAGTRIDSPITNGGTLSSEVSGQALIINGGGSQTGGGTLATTAGALLDFFGGTFTVPAGTAPFSGSGFFRVNGGTLAITGNITNFPAGATLAVMNGNLDVATSTTFQVGQLHWTGGNLRGNGTTRTFGGFIGNIAPTAMLDNHTLTIPASSFNYDGNHVNYLIINNTANLNVENGATMFITSNGRITGTTTDGVTVAGTLTKTGSGVAVLDVPLTTQSGTFVSFGATGGTLQLNGGGSSNVPTTIDTAASGIIEFSGGTFTMGTGNTVTGSGTIKVNGGTLNVNTPAITFPGFQFFSGTLGGSGTVTLTNGGTWFGGTMTGSGTTVVGAGIFSIMAGTPKTLGRNFTNNSGVGMSGGFDVTGASTITNGSGAFWSDTSSSPINCSGCTGRFENNAGATFTLLGGFTQNYTIPFDNDGVVQFASLGGRLDLSGGGTHTGDFDLTGATIFSKSLGFGGTHTFSATSDTFGTGFVTYGGPIAHLGTISLTGNGGVIVGGAVTFDTASAVTTPIIIISGDVGGTGAINLTGPGTSIWNNGTISGTGAFTIGSGATFAVIIPGTRTLLGRTITNNGTFDLEESIAAGLTPGAIVNNNGFRANPAGSIVVGPPFTNTSLAQFGLGSVAFNGGYTQTAGTTDLTGGSFTSPFPVNIDGGSVIGSGTIGASVINDGTFAPGHSAGTITVGGNYTQSSTGVINAEIGGTAPGTQYDQLIVTGNAALDGTINVTTINGFTPSDNNTFDLVTWASHTGAFATVNLPTFPAGTLNATYEPNAFRITADFVGDLTISKSGPANAAFGSNVNFTITVQNLGPSAADNVVVSDPTPANMSWVTNGGDCNTAFPCSLGTIAAGATKTITATFTITGGAGSTITNTAGVTTTSTDNVSANNTASATVFVDLSDLGITKVGPTRADPASDITFTITIANGGQSAAQNVVVNDPTPAGLSFLENSGACTTPFPCNLGTIAGGDTKVILATYTVDSGTPAGTITNTATVSTSTTDDPANNSSSATVIVRCLNSAPENLSPNGSAAGSGTLSWNGTGESYIVYLGKAGSGCTTQFATTSSNSVAYSGLEPGTYEWRVESLSANCRSFTSACVTFTVASDCVVPAAPVVSVVGQTTSSKTYDVMWEPVVGATRYEIEEANNPDFLGSTRFQVTGTSQSFKHDVAEATAFYYRVFAFTACTPSAGPASTTVRVVIIPLPPKEQKNPSATVPVGSEEVIVQQVFIPGEAGQNLFFTAATDRPWLTVRPEQGVITPDGITLDVLADPKTLPNGTFTASVIVTVTSNDGRVGTTGTTTVITPISINLVTPVTPIAAKPSTSQYALIIPSAGHLAGIDSQWQSDVRVTNAGFRSARYQLTFTPSGGTAQGVKTTTITVDAGATTALDDIVKNWFGLGALSDGVNGMLEILPLDDPATTAQSTVASSRTYNVTGNGTLGQYIPAVPFPSFIGRSTNATQQILSLQQIAQNSAYRTNVGLAEAGGAPVNAVLTVFGATGAKLTEIPVTLAAGEQRQMNQLLAQHGIELADGRIEVRVTGGDGKVTAYASVVDSGTQDPLLVSGQLLAGGGSSKYVLAGVANLDNALAHWRTDMRVFNYGTTSQPATLTFFPFNNGASKSVNVLLGAGQVMTLDNVLKSQFDIENQGGVVHLSTPNAASLVVTGRTYNQTDHGTFGQFIPAVTAEQAVGIGGRTLHILQVEDSTRYRTNVGLAEVTGKPAMVEVQVVLPDSKVTPTVQIPLAANEFRQFNVIRELGAGNVYNARITIRVIGGDGRVTAYGSVIDELTQDPTYVPAQ